MQSGADGGFELKDMARWLPQQLAAKKAAGMGGATKTISHAVGANVDLHPTPARKPASRPICRLRPGRANLYRPKTAGPLDKSAKAEPAQESN